MCVFFFSKRDRESVLSFKLNGRNKGKILKLMNSKLLF